MPKPSYCKLPSWEEDCGRRMKETRPGDRGGEGQDRERGWKVWNMKWIWLMHCWWNDETVGFLNENTACLAFILALCLFIHSVHMLSLKCFKILRHTIRTPFTLGEFNGISLAFMISTVLKEKKMWNCLKFDSAAAEGQYPVFTTNLVTNKCVLVSSRGRRQC